MDRLIASWPSEPDGDLRVCFSRGVAYQVEMPAEAESVYDVAYFEKLRGYESSDIGRRLHAARVAMLARNAPDGASVLDYGAGCGAFVRAARSWGFEAFGFDINPASVAHLRESGGYAEDVGGFEAVTFWDSLEHMPDPAAVLAKVRVGAVVLAAIPIFRDLRRIRESKHYRPTEHIYHWTPAGFEHWMEYQGFELVEDSDHEVKAGRESIGAYAFRKVSEALL